MKQPPLRLYDTHAHFFTNDIARFPIEITGAREGRESILHRIDAAPATAARVLDLWDMFHVTGGTAVQYNTVYKTDNSYTVSVADAHRDRISAVLILDAADAETPAKLDTLARAHNVSGLRLFGYPDDNGDYPWLDSPAALDTWEVAAALKLAMVVMYAPGRPSAAALGRIAALAKRFAPMTIALDHCGWPALDAGVEGTLGAAHQTLIEVPNIVFKFTQINFNHFRQHGLDAAQFLRHIVDTYGVERVMWGSDYGNSKQAYADMVGQAVAATSLLDDAERDQVLHGNGQRFFAGRPR